MSAASDGRVYQLRLQELPLWLTRLIHLVHRLSQTMLCIVRQHAEVARNLDTGYLKTAGCDHRFLVPKYIGHQSFAFWYLPTRCIVWHVVQVLLSEGELSDSENEGSSGSNSNRKRFGRRAAGHLPHRSFSLTAAAGDSRPSSARFQDPTRCTSPPFLIVNRSIICCCCLHPVVL